MVKLNVEKFKTLIKKGTLNNSIDGLQLIFKEGRVKTDMISGIRDIITSIDIPNDVIELTEHDDITFNLADPMGTLLPYLDISQEIIDVEIIQDTATHDRIIFHKRNQKGYITRMTYHFCKNAILQHNIYPNARNRNHDNYLLEFPIDDELLKIFDEIRKIGMRFGKIYMSVEDNKFLIGTYDRNNSYSNQLISPIMQIEHEDLEICFDYKNFINLLSIIENEMSKEDGKRFNMRFIYITNVNDIPNAIIQTISEDKTEQYFLINRES